MKTTCTSDSVCQWAVLKFNYTSVWCLSNWGTCHVCSAHWLRTILSTYTFPPTRTWLRCRDYTWARKSQRPRVHSGVRQGLDHIPIVPLSNLVTLRKLFCLLGPQFPCTNERRTAAPISLSCSGKQTRARMWGPGLVIYNHHAHKLLTSPLLRLRVPSLSPKPDFIHFQHW